MMQVERKQKVAQQTAPGTPIARRGVQRLEGIFKPDENSGFVLDIDREVQRLEGISKSGEHFEFIPRTYEIPPHVISTGKVQYEGWTDEVRTAIRIRLGLEKDSDDIEFSTNVGQVPGILGPAIVDRLNQRLKGKFVTLESEQPNAKDVVYTSSSPADWLDSERIHIELENHAKALTIAGPILKAAWSGGFLPSRRVLPDLNGIAQEIVDSNLGLAHKTSDKTKYLPKIERSLE